MAGPYLRDPVTGKYAKKNGRLIPKSCAAACCPIPPNCQCGDGTHRLTGTVRLTISDLNVTTGCLPTSGIFPDASSYKYDDLTALNDATYVIALAPDPDRENVCIGDLCLDTIGVKGWIFGTGCDSACPLPGPPSGCKTGYDCQPGPPDLTGGYYRTVRIHVESDWIPGLGARVTVAIFWYSAISDVVATNIFSQVAGVVLPCGGSVTAENDPTNAYRTDTLTFNTWDGSVFIEDVEATPTADGDCECGYMGGAKKRLTVAEKKEFAPYLNQPFSTPTGKSVAVVQLGRLGDHLVQLPALRWLHEQQGCEITLVTLWRYMRHFSNSSWLKIVPYYSPRDGQLGVEDETDWQGAIKFAETLGVDEVRLSQIGHVDGLKTGAWDTEVWTRTGVPLELFGALPLILPDYGVEGQWRMKFQQQLEERTIRENRKTDKPYLLVNLRGQKVDCTHLRKEIQFDDAPFEVIDLSNIRVNEIGHLLGLYRYASAILTVDTATLHLARVHQTPTIALTNPRGASTPQPYWRYWTPVDCETGGDWEAIRAAIYHVMSWEEKAKWVAMPQPIVKALPATSGASLGHPEQSAKGKAGCTGCKRQKA